MKKEQSESEKKNLCQMQLNKVIHVMRNYNLANKLIISALLEKFEMAHSLSALCV